VRFTPEVVPDATLAVAAAALGMFAQVRVVSAQVAATLSTSYVRVAVGAVDIVSCSVALWTRAVVGIDERSKRRNARRLDDVADCTLSVVEVPAFVLGVAWSAYVSAAADLAVDVIVTGSAAAPSAFVVGPRVAA
jgi:hypothetical protein